MAKHFVARATGFEPVVSFVTGRRDNQVTLRPQLENPNI